MSIELGVLTAHVPRICHRGDNVPAFYNSLIDGMDQTAEMIRKVGPDVIVLVSCHWMSTFDHLVDTTAVHKGVLTALECPDLITDVPYHYPGDQDLGTAIVDAGRKSGLRIVNVNDPTYVWDYGTVVPLRYLVPREDIPVIDLSVTWAASLDETYQWGQRIGKLLRESDKRAVFVSSGALSHNLVRGPEIMPTAIEQAMDQKFTDCLLKCDFETARQMLPQYARAAGVESGGRHLAMLLGVLEGEYKSRYLGEGQSSGSWNVVMTFEPA